MSQKRSQTLKEKVEAGQVPAIEPEVKSNGQKDLIIMGQSVSPNSNKDTKRKSNEKEDPRSSSPKSISPFFWFSREMRPIVKAENPDFSTGEVAKEMGRLWARLDPGQKSKYQVHEEIQHKLEKSVVQEGLKKRQKLEKT